MQHKLGLGRGTGGEVKNQWIARIGRPVRLEIFIGICSIAKPMPTRHIGADRHASPCARCKPLRIGRSCNHRPHRAAVEPILQIIAAQEW